LLKNAIYDKVVQKRTDLEKITKELLEKEKALKE
jgi:hypothetical protein